MPRVSANLTDEAREGWRRFCAEHGVTFTGTVEAAGILMARQPRIHQGEVVELARSIDWKRENPDP